MKNDIKNITGNTLEIHYWFNDKSHTMDAFIQNKCEYEILGIISEISKKLSVEITIETEPLANGGLRKWLKVVSKNEITKATISTSIITAFIISVLVTPLSKITEKTIDKILENSEIKELERKKLILEVEKLKQETNLDFENNILIKKKKSNLYYTLNKYPKITDVSFVVNDDNKQTVFKERKIKKKTFDDFILVSDDLEPIENENALIEIISPVLKKGKYKWTGYYKDEPISFRMKSNEFKTLIQNGEIEFKNGFTIDCHLEIQQKVNNEGIIKIKGYSVLMVNRYFVNDKPVETKEGRKHRKKKEAEKSQYKLFDNIEK